ncbi:MAG: tetratricopeptide repeat protein [Candidatus Zixiibacteriota bacterium]|nr:MAG: tetratricopeptide repeat protein [candidate division Zixibacteria bacterium]
MNGTPVRFLLFSAALFCLVFAVQCGKETKDTGALLQAGRQALDSGDFNTAINLFKEALEQKPSDRDLLYYLAISYKRFDLIDSAYYYFRRARVYSPRDRDINKELVELCPIYGDYDCAINAIAVMVVTGDNEKMYWPVLAELYYRKNDPDMAVKYYRLLIDDDPDDKSYYLPLATTLSQMGQFEQSNQVLLLAEKNLGPSSEGFANIAVNYINLERFDKAEEFFRKSLAVNPENIPVWINLAQILSSRNDVAKKREALEIYKRYQAETPRAYNLDSVIAALESELGE